MPYQREMFLVEGMSLEDLDLLLASCEALACCANYEWDSPVNLAVRITCGAVREELYRRGLGPVSRYGAREG